MLSDATHARGEETIEAGPFGRAEVEIGRRGAQRAS
jgi:hypothetical protein